jgi:hypothetical protein
MNITEAFLAIKRLHDKATATEQELHDHYVRMAGLFGEGHEVTDDALHEWQLSRTYARGLFDALSIVSPTNTTHE